jgi:hypothetical protein
MKTIFKYTLVADIGGKALIDLPVGAEILTCQLQGASPCIWAIVDPGMENELRTFYIIPTGNGFPKPKGLMKYIATIQPVPFVFHVFENIK